MHKKNVMVKLIGFSRCNNIPFRTKKRFSILHCFEALLKLFKIQNLEGTQKNRKLRKHCTSINLLWLCYTQSVRMKAMKNNRFALFSKIFFYYNFNYFIFLYIVSVTFRIVQYKMH